MNRQDIGALGEKHARRLLKKNGYKIIAKNLHQSHNEIDIIACNKDALVFVEVKSRTQTDRETLLNSAAAAVTYQKQQRIICAAKQFVARNPKSASDKEIRFDVIEIYFDKISGNICSTNHIINAFGIKK